MKSRIRCKKNATIEERLRLHMIEAPSGCWIWTGAIGTNGYGRMQVGGRCGYAHRISYTEFVGTIPDGYQIDHLCRRTNCINPLHLQAVTPAVNVRRGTSPGARAQRRLNCLRGHPYSEFGTVIAGRRICQECQREASIRYDLKPRTVHPELRAARKAAGFSQVEVAAMVGCSQGHVSSVERGMADANADLLAALHGIYGLKVAA